MLKVGLINEDGDLYGDKNALEFVLHKIKEGRKKDGKPTDNQYYICNKDEPYSEKVLQVISEGEDNKTNKDSSSILYIKGYDQALKDINIPMKMIQEKWNPSECPRCMMSFHDYEECDDGYYQRAYSLERCPYCGQKIKWEE